MYKNYDLNMTNGVKEIVNISAINEQIQHVLEDVGPNYWLEGQK